jgi:hypothetical protein
LFATEEKECRRTCCVLRVGLRFGRLTFFDGQTHISQLILLLLELDGLDLRKVHAFCQLILESNDLALDCFDLGVLPEDGS